MKKEITVCDFCDAFGRLLFNCIGCGKDSCHNCKGYINLARPYKNSLYAFSAPLELCKDCVNNDSIKSIVMTYDNKIYELCEQRDTKIRMLGHYS